jgi:nucleoid-associated protein YgaU
MSGTERTISFPGRVDICSVATLLKGYNEAGIFIRSKSDLIWQAVEELSKVAESRGTVRFEDVDEAIAYMDQVGMSLKTNNRAIRSLISAQHRQVAAQDFGRQDFPKPLTNKKQMAIDDNELLRRDYVAMTEVQASRGLPPPTIEEFKKMRERARREIEERTRPMQAVADEQEDEPVVETVDPAEREKRERERIATEKAAYSPDALRQAMKSGG